MKNFDKGSFYFGENVKTYSKVCSLYTKFIFHWEFGDNWRAIAWVKTYSNQEITLNILNKRDHRKWSKHTSFTCISFPPRESSTLSDAVMVLSIDLFFQSHVFWSIDSQKSLNLVLWSLNQKNLQKIILWNILIWQYAKKIVTSTLAIYLTITHSSI